MSRRTIAVLAIALWALTALLAMIATQSSGTAMYSPLIQAAGTAATATSVCWTLRGMGRFSRHRQSELFNHASYLHGRIVEKLSAAQEAKEVSTEIPLRNRENGTFNLNSE